MLTDETEWGPTIDVDGEVQACRSLSPQCAPLEVATSVDATGAPLIVVCGEIDLSNVAVLESAIDAVAVGSTERIVIDMSEVSFLSSVGLRALMQGAERVGSLCLRGPSEAARRVLEISGLAGTVLSIES